jgi:hypothetical protein
MALLARDFALRGERIQRLEDDYGRWRVDSERALGVDDVRPVDAPPGAADDPHVEAQVEAVEPWPVLGGAPRAGKPEPPLALDAVATADAGPAAAAPPEPADQGGTGDPVAEWRRAVRDRVPDGAPDAALRRARIAAVVDAVATPGHDLPAWTRDLTEQDVALLRLDLVERFADFAERGETDRYRDLLHRLADLAGTVTGTRHHRDGTVVTHAEALAWIRDPAHVHRTTAGYAFYAEGDPLLEYAHQVAPLTGAHQVLDLHGDENFLFVAGLPVTVDQFAAAFAWDRNPRYVLTACFAAQLADALAHRAGIQLWASTDLVISGGFIDGARPGELLTARLLDHDGTARFAISPTGDAGHWELFDPNEDSGPVIVTEGSHLDPGPDPDWISPANSSSEPRARHTPSGDKSNPLTEVLAEIEVNTEATTTEEAARKWRAIQYSFRGIIDPGYTGALDPTPGVTVERHPFDGLHQDGSLPEPVAAVIQSAYTAARDGDGDALSELLKRMLGDPMFRRTAQHDLEVFKLSEDEVDALGRALNEVITSARQTTPVAASDAVRQRTADPSPAQPPAPVPESEAGAAERTALAEVIGRLMPGAVPAELTAGGGELYVWDSGERFEVEFVDAWVIPGGTSRIEVRDDRVVARIRRPGSEVSGTDQERAWWEQVITGVVYEGMEAWRFRGDTGHDHTERIRRESLRRQLIALSRWSDASTNDPAFRFFLQRRVAAVVENLGNVEVRRLVQQVRDGLVPELPRNIADHLRWSLDSSTAGSGVASAPRHGTPPPEPTAWPHSAAAEAEARAWNQAVASGDLTWDEWQEARQSMVSFVQRHRLDEAAARSELMSGVEDVDTRVAFAAILNGAPFYIPLDEVFDGCAWPLPGSSRSGRPELLRGMPAIALDRVVEAAHKIINDRVNKPFSARGEERSWHWKEIRRWLRAVSEVTGSDEWQSIVDKLPGLLPRGVGLGRTIREILEDVTNRRSR